MSRWTGLLAADRIDVAEHRLASAVWLLPAVAALGVGFRVTARAAALGVAPGGARGGPLRSMVR